MTQAWKQLMTVEDWESALQASADKPVLVFKHSTRCSVSADAIEDFKAYLEDQSKQQTLAVTPVLVHVVEERAVSNAIAEQLALQHASPQLILVSAGNVLWHTSHWNITYAALEEHIQQHCGK